MKKLLLGMGTLAVIATPVVAVISCGSTDNSRVQVIELKEEAKGITLTVDNNVVTHIDINTFLLKDLDSVKKAFNAFIWCVDAGKEWPDLQPTDESTDDGTTQADGEDASTDTTVELDENGNPIEVTPEEEAPVVIPTWHYDYDEAQARRIFGMNTKDFTFGEGTSINLYNIISIRGPKADQIINEYFIQTNPDFPKFEGTDNVITPERARALEEQTRLANVRAINNAALTAAALDAARASLELAKSDHDLKESAYNTALGEEETLRNQFDGAQVDLDAKQALFDAAQKVIDDEKAKILGGKTQAELGIELTTQRAEVERLEGLLGKSYTKEEAMQAIQDASTPADVVTKLNSLVDALNQIETINEANERVTILSEPTERIQTRIDNYMTQAERAIMTRELESYRTIASFDPSKINDQRYIDNFVIGGYQLTDGVVIPEGVTLKAWESYTRGMSVTPGSSLATQVQACTDANLPKPSAQAEHSLLWMKANLFTSQGVRNANEKVIEYQTKLGSQVSLSITVDEMNTYKTMVEAVEAAQIELNVSKANLDELKGELDKKTEETKSAKEALDQSKSELDAAVIAEDNANNANAAAVAEIDSTKAEHDKAIEILANVQEINIAFPPVSKKPPVVEEDVITSYKLPGIMSANISVNLNQDGEFVSFSATMFDNGGAVLKALEEIAKVVSSHAEGLASDDQAVVDAALERVISNPGMFNKYIDIPNPDAGKPNGHGGVQPATIRIINPDFLIPSLYGTDASIAPDNAREIALAIVGVFTNAPADLTELLDDATRIRVNRYQAIEALRVASKTAYDAAYANATAKPLLLDIVTKYNSLKSNHIALDLFNDLIDAIESQNQDRIDEAKTALNANALGKALVDSVTAGSANALVKAWIDAELAELQATN